MARTITEIQNEIIAAVQADTTLSGVNSGSATAIWRLWTRVVAAAIWALELLFDAHRVQVLEDVAKLKPHSLRWYQQKALDFQLGSDLVEGEDYYDNSGLTVDEIAEQKIVAQAAVVEEGDRLIVKVAQEIDGELEPLDTGEYDVFVAYINEVKDAGVTIDVLSFDADSLTIVADIYYDPLVLDSSGARLDGADAEPVQNAIKSFLRTLPFNGLFVKAHLVDALQAVDGVFVPEIRTAQAARFGSSSAVTIDVKYQPYSGFLRIYDDETDLTLTFIQQ